MSDGVAYEGQTHRLRANSISLAGLTAQAIGTNGPELNAAATTAVIFVFAGTVTPFLFLLALIPGFCYARTIGGFAKKMVSAGGTYQIVRRTLGDRVGLFGGSVYFIGLFLFVGGTAALAAYVLGLVGAAVVPGDSWFAHGHWFEISIVVLLVCGWLAWRGVNVSVRLLLGLSGIGVAVILVLDLVILFSNRDTGFTLSSMLPWNADVTFTNFAVGFGLAMGCFAAVEAAVFLGEEAHAPTQMVPRAINIAVAVLLAFCFVNALAISKGVGPSHINDVGAQGSGILQTLGAEYVAGWFGDLLLLVVATGAITSVLGCINVCARLIFDWGREGQLPSVLGRVHGKNATPHNAVLAVTVASIAVCLAGLAWQGNDATAGSTVYGLVVLVGVLLLLSMYVLISLAAIVETVRSTGWRISKIVAPLVVIIAMGLSIFSQIHPFPAPPFSSAPVIALILFGVSILWAIFSRPTVTSRSPGALPSET